MENTNLNRVMEILYDKAGDWIYRAEYMRERRVEAGDREYSENDIDWADTIAEVLKDLIKEIEDEVLNVFNKEVYETVRDILGGCEPVDCLNIDISEEEFIKLVDDCEFITNWDCIVYDNLHVMDFTEIEDGIFNKDNKQAYILEDELYDFKYNVIDMYNGSLKEYMGDHNI